MWRQDGLKDCVPDTKLRFDFQARASTRHLFTAHARNYITEELVEIEKRVCYKEKQLQKKKTVNDSFRQIWKWLANQKYSVGEYTRGASYFYPTLFWNNLNRCVRSYRTCLLT